MMMLCYLSNLNLMRVDWLSLYLVVRVTIHSYEFMVPSGASVRKGRPACVLNRSRVLVLVLALVYLLLSKAD